MFPDKTFFHKKYKFLITPEQILVTNYQDKTLTFRHGGTTMRARFEDIEEYLEPAEETSAKIAPVQTETTNPT